MIPHRVPQVRTIGEPRLTLGLDRNRRLDLATHRAVHGRLSRQTLDRLITMAEEVDLRGRGGAAFPFARKLKAVTSAARARRSQPVVLVNAAEGEPGSAKDKMLLTRAPHLVLDGAMLAADALEAAEIVIGIAEGAPAVASMVDAIDEAGLRTYARVVEVPHRFVSGEGGALVRGVNGETPIPPGQKVRASDSGVDGVPTLLSNAETFAQLAVLARLGPGRYAELGTTREPGTVLVTVGGSAEYPAVVEVPFDTPLATVLELCSARVGEGVLLGGFHGAWVNPVRAATATISRQGLSDAGGTLGAGIVLPLGEDTCALGEAVRVAGYLAVQSSGQCGPCRFGLPEAARALAALAEGNGGAELLDLVRRAAAAPRGRGACHHPDGTARFVLSAVEVFAYDIVAHVVHGSCGRPVRGVLPVPVEEGELRLVVDRTRCEAHGLCAYLAPELIRLDRQGYPDFLDAPVPFWLRREAHQAVEMCPALALRLDRAQAQPDPESVATRRQRMLGRA